jgi:hypothetical protein
MPKDYDARRFLRSKADSVFYLLVLFGISAVLLHQRTTDFMGEDVFYADAAQSFLRHGSYAVNGVNETTQPPGLSAILALLFAIFGQSYATAVCSMAVFETLGFLLFYEFLRRRAPWIIAAGICILLMSSPLYFAWASRMVYPCFAYFFTTMFALLAYEEYENAAGKRSTIAWGGLLTLAVLASLLIATSTAALLGAMLAVMLCTALNDRRLARMRALRILPVLGAGVLMLGLWLGRSPAPLDWALPGYPGPYLQQLRLKSGNHPELGLAHWQDIPVRVRRNLAAESDILTQLMLRHGVKQNRVEVIIVPLLLIAVGWLCSVLKARGTEFVDWYFFAYQFIYLLWPWTMDPRYLLPIAPLACFYLWRGIKGVVHSIQERPRWAGSVGALLGLLLAISGLHRIRAHESGGASKLLDFMVVALWLGLAVSAAWVAYWKRPPFAAGLNIGRRHIDSILGLRYASYAATATLIMLGLAIDFRIGRENIHARTSIAAGQTGPSEFLSQEVEAGLWLRDNTPQDSIVMARHWPTVRHYAERKLIWFAPISDPSTLFEGIRRHAVNYIVVVRHVSPYYLPDDEYCFDHLREIHAAAFQLVFQADGVRIFRVNSK